MYQNIRPIDAVQRIDSIVDQTKVRAVGQLAIKTQTESKATFNQQGKPKEDFFSKDDLEKMTVEATEAISVVNRELSFRVHEGTGRPLIQLIESDSKEVIREIPSEKMLDVVAGIWELAGLIVDRKD